MPMISTGYLNMEVSLYGAEKGQPLLLIHGWPDDASTWEQVAPALAAEGFRVIVPTLRGFGATRFLDDDAPRTGDSAMLAIDMIALLDALEIDRFMVAGHDWGSNTAEALAVGWRRDRTRRAMRSSPATTHVALPSERPIGGETVADWQRSGRSVLTHEPNRGSRVAVAVPFPPFGTGADPSRYRPRRRVTGGAAEPRNYQE